MAISSRRAAAGFAPPLSAGRSNTAPTSPGTSKPSTISMSSPAILSIWLPNSAAEDPDRGIHEIQSPLHAIEALVGADHLRLETGKTILLRPIRSAAPNPGRSGRDCRNRLGAAAGCRRRRDRATAIG